MSSFAEAVAHFRAGRAAEAAGLCDALLAKEPGHAQALHLLGMIRFAAGDAASAASLLQRAVDSAPDYAEAHYNLGVIRQRLGEAAVGSYRRCLELRPDWAAPRINLGSLLLEQGAAREAEAALRPAVVQEPLNPDALHNLGSALLAQGQKEEAAALLERAVAQAPDRLESRLNLGVALYDNGKFSIAESQFRAILERQPDHPDALFNLANTRKACGDLEGAMALYRQLLRLVPAHAGALNNLGGVYFSANRMVEAAQTYERLAAVSPRSAAAYGSLAASYLGIADCNRALAASRRATELLPDDWDTRRGHMLVLNLAEGIEARDILAEARTVHEKFLAPLRPARAEFAVERQSERRLRLGVIGGPMLRAHTLSSVLLPMLEALDREQFDIVSYSDLPPAAEDQISGRYKALGGWRCTIELDDEQFAAALRDDRIDVAVDPMNFVDGTRLRALARRPAPLQLSYPLMATCGGDTIDAVIADRALVTADLEDCYAEAVARVPFAYCYAPYRPTPAVVRSPAACRGHVTFGSLNTLSKVSPGALQAWARILASVPTSRLLIKARPLSDDALCQEVRRRFGEQRIAAERLELQGWSPDYASHMATFNAIDIALDSFPYGGVTTTCEALWMGVPVITRPGTRALERYGASILSTAGFAEGIASGTDDYVERAVQMAREPHRLEPVRADLAARFRASPVCDAAAAARAFGQACRTLWRRWCGGGS